MALESALLASQVEAIAASEQELKLALLASLESIQVVRELVKEVPVADSSPAEADQGGTPLATGAMLPSAEVLPAAPSQQKQSGSIATAESNGEGELGLEVQPTRSQPHAAAEARDPVPRDVAEEAEKGLGKVTHVEGSANSEPIVDQPRSAFDRSSFRSDLADAETMPEVLQKSIAKVEVLRHEVVERERQARLAELTLEKESEADRLRNQEDARKLQRARDNLRNMSNELEQEKEALNSKGLLVHHRINGQSLVNQRLKAELRGLEDWLLAQKQEMEARIAAAKQRSEARELEVEAKKVEMDAANLEVVGRQQELEEWREENFELRSFLDDREGAVNGVRESMLECADKVEELRRKILSPATVDAHPPLQRLSGMLSSAGECSQSSIACDALRGGSQDGGSAAMSGFPEVPSHPPLLSRRVMQQDAAELTAIVG